MGKGSSQTQETKISDAIGGPAGDIAGQLGSFLNVNPWDLDYTGARVAAVNDAQKQAMDMPAMAGNAYNMGFTPASQFLPESTKINGVDTYDVLGMAKQGISPQLQSILDRMFNAPAAATPRGLAPGQAIEYLFGSNNER